MESRTRNWTLWYVAFNH